MKSIYTAKIEEENLARFLPDVNMADRDKEIVRKYLDDKPTYIALGEAYEISGERIRQIISESLEILKDKDYINIKKKQKHG